MHNGTSRFFCLILAGLLAFALCACGGTGSGKEVGNAAGAPSEETTIYTNGGMILSVPVEYDELLVVETQKESEDGTLFTVSEKESVQWGERQHPGEDWGDGWLFGIRKIGEKELHEMLCYDMPGEVPFAKDGKENYYVFSHPTDVRLVRESYDFDSESEDVKQWTALNEWAWKVPKSVLTDNAGLTSYTVTNTPVDVCLYRLAYLEDEFYMIGTPQYGSLSPNGVNKMPYVKKLLDGVTYKLVDSSETPDGEFVVLHLPDSGERLDFFFADGNYVREIHDEVETLYRASYSNKDFSAAQVMQDWYDALAKAGQGE